MTENANLVELLRTVGWSGDQVCDFILGVEGRLGIEEAAARIKEGEKKR